MALCLTALTLSPLHAHARGRTAAGAEPSETSAPLYFDPRLPFSRLLVTARIDGHAAVFAIDTGSPMNVLSLPLARSANLPMDLAATKFPDAMGRPHEAFALRVGGVVDGLGVPIDKLSASEWADLHDGKTAHAPHMDGVLSPQLLAMPGEAIVLDLPRGKIGAMRWPDAERSVAHRAQTLVDARIGADGHFFAHATVDGIPRTMVVDTGAPNTTLFAPRDAELPSSATRHALRRIRLAVGEVSHSVVAQEVEAIDSDGIDGLIGLDVLGACTIAISADRLLARCDRVGDPSTTVLDVRHHHATICGANEVCFETRADGSYVYRGVHILPNGRLDDWGGSPSDLRKLYDETRELRHEIEHDYDLHESFEGLPHLLDRVWNDPKLAPGARREIVFEVWDECAEPDDPELAHEGAKARRIIDGYVRAKRDRYTAAELDAFRKRRARAPYFDPYRREIDDDFASR
jgi:hypothetical protein